MIRAVALTTLFAAATLLSGCSTNSAVDPCDPAAVGDAEACRNVLKAATEHLGLSHGLVASTRFVGGSMCPPNARCAMRMPGSGTAIFTFFVGDPVMIFVVPEPRPAGAGSVLTAGDPQPVPEWYLEQMATETH